MVFKFQSDSAGKNVHWNCSVHEEHRKETKKKKVKCKCQHYTLWQQWNITHVSEMTADNSHYDHTTWHHWLCACEEVSNQHIHSHNASFIYNRHVNGKATTTLHADFDRLLKHKQLSTPHPFPTSESHLHTYFIKYQQNCFYVDNCLYNKYICILEIHKRLLAASLTI